MRRAHGIALLAALAVGVTWTSVARAQLTEGGWVAKEIQNGNAEVQFSELAVKQAHSPKVKLFAAKMIKDHKKVGARLNEMARTMNLSVPAGLNKDQAGTVDGLKRLSGADFDRAYLTRMVQDHEKAVKSYENEAKNGSNADLKKIANDALPHLQEHLKEARQLANDLGSK